MSDFPEISFDLIEEGILGYHQFMSEDHDAYSKEKFLYGDVGKVIREQRYLTMEQLELILNWRQPIIPNHYQQNDKERLKIISRQALGQQDEEIKTHILTLIKGIAIPSASKILSITFPDKYLTINRMAWEVLSQWRYLDGKYSITPNSWMKFLHTARVLMKKYQITGKQLDQALIAIHLKYKMNLNLKNFVPLDQFF